MTDNHLKIDPWKIIEEGFDKQRGRCSESLFSMGNGRMGGRANFEEWYSGDTLRGNYVGGVYYPDKTRVGWWKNGYPEYFAKVLNSAFWIGVDVKINGERVDLNSCKIDQFRRELNMKEGVLYRTFKATLSSGAQILVESMRFFSMARYELGAISYSITPLSGDVNIELTPYVDANVKNEDANYDEKFWIKTSQSEKGVTMQTNKTAFRVSWHQEVAINVAGEFLDNSEDELVSKCIIIKAAKNQKVTLNKYVGITSSLNHDKLMLEKCACEVAESALHDGFDKLLAEQKSYWAAMWDRCDIEIKGDDKSQQGIRFCIFQLLQTYTGDDARLNVGPKGFTGEKYGGTTYWDTEAYCMQFYMSTAGEDVARELLKYRYNQLDKAIENGTKLGFKDGAALYPMVTANGEECHNEWEITFEEIHRNGSIAFAIFNYIRYTGKKSYLAEYGLEVLLSIARFWSQRITFSADKGKYVMLGVTGPNEYENNINNNWYTSYLALWCMRYAKESAQYVEKEHNEQYKRICQIRNFDYESETKVWQQIIDNMYLPYNEDLEVFMQQDGYMDKEQILAAHLPKSERPINQKWSWDRILRSCFIKQADVLQGIYLFQDDFDIETLKRNFYFYESRTVHESSLSPCVHAILAAKIGDMDKALEMYLRTSRLDIDDYNNEIRDGLHITSMAGSWLSVVEGFGGMRVKDGMLCFCPSVPANWESLSFKVNFRGRVIRLTAKKATAKIEILSGDPIDVVLER